MSARDLDKKIPAFGRGFFLAGAVKRLMVCDPGHARRIMK